MALSMKYFPSTGKMLTFGKLYDIPTGKVFLLGLG
jgi:hypothetical protein